MITEHREGARSQDLAHDVRTGSAHHHKLRANIAAGAVNEGDGIGFSVQTHRRPGRPTRRGRISKSQNIDAHLFGGVYHAIRTGCTTDRLDYGLSNLRAG